MLRICTISPDVPQGGIYPYRSSVTYLEDAYWLCFLLTFVAILLVLFVPSINSDQFPSQHETLPDAGLF